VTDSGDPGRLEFQFPPDLGYLRTLRRHLRGELASNGVSEDLRNKVLLVLDEIVTNAIDHGAEYRVGDGHLTLRLAVERTEVSLEFEDPDVPLVIVQRLAAMLASGGELPPIEAERGRGLILLAASVDSLVVTPRAAGGLHLAGRILDG